MGHCLRHVRVYFLGSPISNNNPFDSSRLNSVRKMDPSGNSGYVTENSGQEAVVQSVGLNKLSHIWESIDLTAKKKYGLPLPPVCAHTLSVPTRLQKDSRFQEKLKWSSRLYKSASPL
jgi:hypothetical protein